MSYVLVAAICLAAILITAFASKASAARYVRRPLLTKTELRFFRQLRDAVPGGLLICPQVGMAAAMEARGGSSRAAFAAFRRISQKRIDFCICDEALEPKFVVELDDHTHDPARDRARDAMLLQAGIRTLRFDVRRLPTSVELQARLRQVQLEGS
jgi:hypothetical protein